MFSYLSARFDALHEAQENNDPREKKSEWQVVLESAEVARLAKAVGDVQDVLLPKLTQIEEDFFHILVYLNIKIFNGMPMTKNLLGRCLGVGAVVRILRYVEKRITLFQLEKGLILGVLQLDAILVSAPPLA